MDSSLPQLPNDRDYDIILRQQPARAKISVPNERDKRSIEPPPIVQMQWINFSDEEKKQSLQSPFYFVMVNIVHAEAPDTASPLPTREYLSGATVSSLYRLRDIDNTDGGFFVFGDLAVRKQGYFRLYFSLFEMIDGIVENRKNILSNAFMVYTTKQYPGPMESTFLSRVFSDQGVKIRVRKNHQLSTTSTSTISPSSFKKKSRTNVAAVARKRKHDNDTSICHQPLKKEVLSPPSYASDNVVHFGRWQSSLYKCKSTPLPNSSMTTNNDHASNTPPSPSMTSSPTLSTCSSSNNNIYLPPISQLSSCNITPIAAPPFYQLPPLREIMNNKHSGEAYTSFPIDTSFFK
ncbi:AP-1 adaptor complex sigma subunit Aps1 [Mucor velutinosus]|uniref:AP-1 adaptor complex sigma subunit Aps1 n=1 Tax=Mucor velutinosus TaxID=708070 RepID=A0AAN7DS63_9FUNG|nr:AP-1 adaptor complex sigma subunit Aps1 [Mucor velutinosus]